jgi:hypothetical protein
MYVAYVSSRYCKSRSGVAYVAMTIHVWCKFQMFYFKRMLQVFYLNITYVAVAIRLCCKCMFQMFHLFQTYVTSVSSRWYICCNVAYVLDICCMCLFKMFHPFQTYVCKCVLSGYCSCYTHICCKRIFINVSPVSDICCRNAFMLQH